MRLNFPTSVFAGPFYGRLTVLAAVLAMIWGSACGSADSSAPGDLSGACAEGRTLRFAFYAFFDPVSSSADPDPDSPGFTEHVGYEADLLTALESMEGAGLQFERTPIAEWPDIWLRPAGPDFDIAGGGITILPSRTTDAEGAQVIEFTSGHIEFRQSLLVRAEDADRYAAHGDLTAGTRVGVLPSTTGESRLLALTGLTDSEGRLAAGTQVVTEAETLIADGSDRFMITPAGSSPSLESRRMLRPSSPDAPTVIYMGAGTGETELLDAVRDGPIDAFARGEIGNVQAAHAYGGGGVFAVTGLDTEMESGGWALPVTERALLECLDDKLNYLTDHRRIGFAEWRSDPQVFLRRAQSWTP